jgi:hypothetical protein
MERCLAGVGCDKEGLLKCARCLTRRYCSVECQKKEWHAHKKFCRPETGKDVENYPLKHTNTPFSGHDENDLIIIYSLLEELCTDVEENARGILVPQWVMTDCVSETRGINAPCGVLIPCYSHKEMESVARHIIGAQSISPFEVREVKFFHTHSLLSMNGMKPFLMKQ